MGHHSEPFHYQFSSGKQVQIGVLILCLKEGTELNPIVYSSPFLIGLNYSNSKLLLMQSLLVPRGP